jgi:hypothetical protein
VESQEWQKVSGSGSLAPIKKFTTVGEAVEGVYHGKSQGKAGYPPLYLVGDVALPEKAQLKKDFAEITVGTYVKVQFQGKVAIEGGKTKNLFHVFKKPAGAPAPAPATAPVADIAAMRAKLEDRIGMDAAAAQINGLVQRIGGDQAAVAVGLRELLTLNGVK